MPIQRVKGDISKVKVGDWVCFESSMLYGVCTTPRLVTEISGQRIYFQRGEGDTKEYKMLKTVMYVCSTEEDGRKLSTLTWQQIDAVAAATAEVKKRYAKMIDDIIEESQKNSQSC